LIQKFPKKAGQVLKNILILVKGDGLKPGMLQVITIAAGVLDKKLPKQYIVFLENILTNEETQEKEPVNVMMCLLKLVNALDKAPYILEEMVDSMLRGEIEDHLVTDTLIKVSVEMFLQRPGEVISILSKLFSFFMNEYHFETLLKEFNEEKGKKENLLFMFTHVVLQQRIRYYYEMLKKSPEKLKEVVLKQNQVSKKKEKTLKSKKLMLNIEKLGFNNLAVIYEKEDELFIKPLDFFSQTKIKEQKVEEEEEEEEESEKEDSEEEESESESEKEEIEEIEDIEKSESENSEESESESESEEKNRESLEETDSQELLDLEISHEMNRKDDEIDFLNLEPESIKPNQTNPEKISNKKQKVTLNMLEENFEIEEDDFQNKWMDFDHEYEDELSIKVSQKKKELFEDEEEIEEIFNKMRIYTLASGNHNGIVKLTNRGRRK
jgi:hypothetical protein